MISKAQKQEHPRLSTHLTLRPQLVNAKMHSKSFTYSILFILYALLHKEFLCRFSVRMSMTFNCDFKGKSLARSGLLSSSLLSQENKWQKDKTTGASVAEKGSCKQSQVPSTQRSWSSRDITIGDRRTPGLSTDKHAFVADVVPKMKVTNANPDG